MDLRLAGQVQTCLCEIDVGFQKIAAMAAAYKELAPLRENEPCGRPLGRLTHCKDR